MDQVHERIEFMAGNDATGKPNAPDRYFQALYQNLADRRLPALFTRVIEEGVDTFKDRSPTNWANLIARTAQAAVHGLKPPGYPNGFDNPESWDMFRAVVSRASRTGTITPKNIDRIHPSPSRFDYITRTWFHVVENVITPVPQRSIGEAMVGLAYDRREPVTIIDYGSGQGLGAKKLVMQGDGLHSFREVALYASRSAVELGIPDREATDKINRAIRRGAFPVRQVIAVDIQDQTAKRGRVELTEHIAWGLNCHYPSELSIDNPTWLEYLDLIGTDLPEVAFHQNDATNFDFEKFEKEFPDFEKADIAFFCTSAYQFPNEVHKAIDDAKKLLKPDGLVVVQDFVDISPGGTFDFAEVWSRFRYKLTVLDLAHEEDGWKQLLEIGNGRFNEAVMLPEFQNRLRASGIISG